MGSQRLYPCERLSSITAGQTTPAIRKLAAHVQVLPLLVVTIATAFSTSSLFRKPTAIMSVRAAVDADKILKADEQVRSLLHWTYHCPYRALLMHMPEAQG